MRALPEIFFFAIVFYVLYRFIFNFVVPIARTTRQVRQQFKHMQEMHEQAQQGQDRYAQGQAYHGQGPQATQAGATQQRKPNSDKVGEYIDFEEVK